MASRFALMLVAAAVVLIPAPVWAEWESRNGAFSLTFESELNPIVINRIHDWLLHIEDARGDNVTGASITVSGGMPAHDHGLPTAPRVTAEPGDGTYLLQGLRFHMPGRWQLEVTIEAGGRRDTVVIPLEL